MKTNYTLKLLIVLSILIAMPVMASAQRRKPRLRRAAPRATVVVAPLVPIGTNLKVRLNDTLSSKESRAGDKFMATVMDPVRFNEGTLHGHIRSIVKSGKVNGRTTMNLAFDSIDLPDEKHGVLHGYVTKVYGPDVIRDLPRREDQNSRMLSFSIRPPMIVNRVT